MKITSFNPLVSTRDVQSTVKVFEDMGFVVKHHPVFGVEIGKFEWVVMENESGFRMDIGTADTTSPSKGDITSIRINVDDFDEGAEFLTSRGFKPAQSQIYENDSLKCFMYMSPTGFLILLVQQKKGEK